MSMSPHTETETSTGLPAEAVATSRRSFVRNAAVGAAVLGAAAATGVSLASSAGAADTTTTETLSAVDTELLIFLQGISLAAQQALQTSSDAGFLSSTYSERLREFSRHHRDQAASLAALLPTDVAAATPANPTLLGQMNAKIGGAGSQSALLGVVGEYEENLSATFIVALGQTDHYSVAEAIAGCAPILGQQASSFLADAGEPQSTWLPAFAPTTGALTQSAYPIR